MKRSYFWSFLRPFDKASFELAANYILKETYSTRRKTGFIVKERATDYICGQYVERETFKETINDPFGKSFEIERVTFHYLPFRLQHKWPQVEFVGGARLHTRFFSRLTPAFPSYLAEGRMTFNIESFLVLLGKKFSNPQVCALRIDGLLINNRTLCGMEFRSSVDVQADAKSIIKEMPSEISYAKVVVDTGRSQAVELEIWKAGKLVTSASPDSDAFDVIRSLVAKETGQFSK